MKTYRITLLDNSYIDVEAVCPSEAIKLAMKQTNLLWYCDISVVK